MHKYNSPLVDSVLAKLVKARYLTQTEFLETFFYNDIQVKELIQEASFVIKNEPNVLKLEAPINIFGDVNGGFFNVLRFFDLCGYPPHSKFLFLGNLVDATSESIYLLLLLLTLKLNFPDCIYLLRGVKETTTVLEHLEFATYCANFKPTNDPTELFDMITDLFEVLPVAAIINEKVFCAHSGINPSYDFFTKLHAIQRPITITIPDEGPVTDLLWAKPNEQDYGWVKSPSDISYVYGADVIAEFLLYHRFQFICRGNSFFPRGFKLEAMGQIVSLCSAPNYQGSQNYGAVMILQADLSYKMQLLEISDPPSPESENT
ncbi:unnamed protein product, partial [Mesorhabditis belari]|uniref:Serine/threonine specific protein phosphatases domain-containing protein n=1 Tax=Mesorhabditis belari TaxID=2138241 RepID=A0AAF3FJQ8_9BILA